jgi:hypothetical protein
MAAGRRAVLLLALSNGLASNNCSSPTSPIGHYLPTRYGCCCGDDRA